MVGYVTVTGAAISPPSAPRSSRSGLGRLGAGVTSVTIHAQYWNNTNKYRVKDTTVSIYEEANHGKRVV